MEIEKLWKTFNVSFILILPLFVEIVNQVKHKTAYKFNIHSLFHDYGLLNTFLFDSSYIYDGRLRLVFDRKKVNELSFLESVDKPIATLLTLILISKYFESINALEDYVVVTLKIDPKWDNDILKIIESKYSQVSREYIDFIINKGVYYKSNDDIINYLSLSNIPAKILTKHKSLTDTILKVFNISTDEDLSEIFNKFNKEEECLRNL